MSRIDRIFLSLFLCGLCDLCGGIFSFAVSSFLCAFPLFAQETPFSSLDCRITQLENEYSESGQNTRESRPFYLTAALLYWWADEVELTYAMEGGLNTPLWKRELLDVKIEPDIGFKLGLGSFLPHDQWDLFLQLTNLHSRTHFHRSSEGEKKIFPLWSFPTNQPEGFIDEVHGHWRLHFALIDLELGKTYSLSKCFYLRPHIGIRYAIIRQKWFVHYEGGTLFPGAEELIMLNNKCLFPGLRTGFNVDWKIKQGWGFYSNTAVSLLYGKMYTHEDQKVPFGGQEFHIIERCDSGIATFDLALGIEWQKSFNQNRHQLGFQLGWEEHLFLGQNNFFRFLQSENFNMFECSREALGLQGITLRARWDF